MAQAPKLNSLIPMAKGAERAFVNAWDVKARERDGWKVIGELRKHVSRVTAPLEELRGDAPAATTSAPANAGPRKDAQHTQTPAAQPPAAPAAPAAPAPRQAPVTKPAKD